MDIIVWVCVYILCVSQDINPRLLAHAHVWSIYHHADLSYIFVFLHVYRLVEGLDKSASLASCDVGVELATNTQNAPASRQQRGKLSSLGKLFKPWKWRKKKTSDKFQDLSKGRTSCML